MYLTALGSLATDARSVVANRSSIIGASSSRARPVCGPKRIQF
jgi:hypothetical protein